MTRARMIGVGAFVILLIAGSAVLFTMKPKAVPQPVQSLLTSDEARLVAAVSNCSDKGTVATDGQYTTGTQTWLFALDPSTEYTKDGCHPVCVVSEVAKSAEVDWRCDPGVEPPTGSVVPAPSTSTVNAPVLKPASKDDLIRVSMPLQYQTVANPMVIQGEARGSWFFEASFPIKVLDANGKLLGSAVAQAQSDWMTNNYVKFKANASFTTSTTPTGTLVLEKDNPSGLAQNANELRFPIRFATVATTQTIKLYYYNPTLDTDASGNILCSTKGLVAVTRTIPKTNAPIQDAVKLLVKGELTPAESDMGITTQFPLSGFELKGASTKGGILTLEFADPQNASSGGSCRASVLWDQIEATAKQFPGVTAVRYIPETLFQP